MDDDDMFSDYPPPKPITPNRLWGLALCTLSAAMVAGLMIWVASA